MKFSIGLGNVSLDPTQAGAVQVVPFSGSRPGGLLGGAAGGVLDVQTPVVQIDPARAIVSRRSTPAHHSTLFEDFGLRAEANYNFFTFDERTNPNQDELVPPRELPRYVELFWNSAPLRNVILQGQKGVKHIDPRITGVRPVLDVRTANESVSNGYVAPGTVQALLVRPIGRPPTRGFSEDQFLTSQAGAGLSAAQFRAMDESDFHSSELPTPSERVRVSFVDPSIAGALAPNRISVSADEVHLATAGSLSKLLAGLEVLSEFNQDVPVRNPPPSFRAPADSPTLAYVGYVIERYDLGPDGEMRLAKTVYVDDPSQRRLVDREVVFGGRYAYRMRSIVQWSHEPTVSFGGDSTLFRDRAFNPAGGTPSLRASFYAGDWSDWTKTEVRDDVLPDPPDELIVRPISHRGVVDVVWKMPNDPQRDVSAVRLLRCVEVSGKLSPWEQLGEFPVGNGRYVDRDVGPFEDTHSAYVYAMYSVSYHGERSVLSEQVEARLVGRSRYARELPLRQVAPRGADPMADSHSARPPVRDWNVVAKGRVGFYIRDAVSAHPLFDRTYVVEIQSLSTGERAQVALSVDSTDVDVGPGSRRRQA